MAILRRDPFENLRNLEKQLSQVFQNEENEDQPSNGLTSWRPRVDVYEENDELVFEVDASGIDKDDLDVSIEDNRLTIRGERKAEHEQSNRDYYRSERVYGTFQRSFALPDSIAEEDVSASYDNGVLTISTPLSQTAEKRSVPIS